MDQEFKLVLITEALCAFATHTWLKRYDPLAFSAVVGALAAIPLLPAFILLGATLRSSFHLIAYAYTAFYVSLIASVVFYRLSHFHPLASYPGPTILRFTKLWSAWVAYTGKTHIYHKALHERYGPVVRIGPNELSIIEKDLIPQIFGNQGMPKGPMWDGRRFAQTKAQKNYDNIVDLRDPVIHAQLRKPWNKAFLAEPMKDYEELLFPRVLQLNSQLKDICQQGGGVGNVDMAKWVSCFSFDFIGDMAFGGCFQLMREGDKYGYFAYMEKALYLPSITHHIPWIAKFLRSFPILNSAMQQFIQFGIEQAMRRSNMEMKRKDLFHHIAEASGAEDKPDFPLIVSNALLAIVAGSDTTSSVLSNALYLLLSHPNVYKRLQKEVDEVFEENLIPNMDTESAALDGESSGRMYGDILAGMTYLNGVINETLRLFPAVPTAFQRAPQPGTGEKVLQYDSISITIPEGNAVAVPAYVIHRDPRYFSPDPEAFIPERWDSSIAKTNSYVTSRDAFIPFSYGPQNCVGRSVAQMEMRYVLATLMRNFEMEFDTPTYDPSRWEGDLKDRFTFEKGVLGARLKVRQATA